MEGAPRRFAAVRRVEIKVAIIGAGTGAPRWPAYHWTQARCHGRRPIAQEHGQRPIGRGRASLWLNLQAHPEAVVDLAGRLRPR
jgi:hypothetical protein